MINILFFRFLNLIGPILFIILPLYMLIKYRNNKISIIISIILILAGGIQLKNTLFESPDLRKSILLYNDLIELEAEEISKIIIKTKYIKRKDKKIQKTITDKNKIKLFLNSMYVNKFDLFEFIDWSTESCYSLELVTQKKQRFKIGICETKDNRSYIDLFYYKNNHFIKIGQYRNNLIKSLNLLELK